VKKKLLATLSITTALCSVAAFAGDARGASAATGGRQATAAAEPQPEAGAHLVMWDDPQYQPGFEAVIKDFQAKYHVPVKFVPLLSAGQQSAKLAVAGPAGKAADVVTTPSSELGTNVSAGLVLPNDVFASSTKDEWPAAATQEVTYNGLLYGYPLSVGLDALYYNKKLVKTPPKTWNDVIAFAKTFNDVKAEKFALVFEPANAWADYGFLSGYGGYVFGGSVTSPNINDVGLNSPAAVQGAKFFQSLKSSVLPLKSGDATYQLATSLFEKGQAAMNIDGPWSIPYFKAVKGLDYGVAPLPMLPNGQPMRPFETELAMFVNAYSKYPIAARLFAHFATSTPELTKLYQTIGMVTPAKGFENSAAVQGDAATRTFLQEYRNSVAVPNVPAMTQVWGPFFTVMPAIWDSGKDPQALLNNAVTQIKSGIAKTKK